MKHRIYYKKEGDIKLNIIDCLKNEDEIEKIFFEALNNTIFLNVQTEDNLFLISSEYSDGKIKNYCIMDIYRYESVLIIEKDKFITKKNQQQKSNEREAVIPFTKITSSFMNHLAALSPQKTYHQLKSGELSKKLLEKRICKRILNKMMVKQDAYYSLKSDLFSEFQEEGAAELVLDKNDQYKIKIETRINNKYTKHEVEIGAIKKEEVLNFCPMSDDDVIGFLLDIVLAKLIINRDGFLEVSKEIDIEEIIGNCLHTNIAKNIALELFENNQINNTFEKIDEVIEKVREKLLEIDDLWFEGFGESAGRTLL